jgi:glutathione S-transferase
VTGAIDRYTLYGSHASYYTGKTRSYLRKKGIPFVERLPSSRRFREYVRPTSGSHRIPQLEAPDGTVVQDSTEIFDFLEARFPEPPALPPGPRQRLVAHLLELLAGEGLGQIAWHYRWNFPEENEHFVVRDFGRSFRPQGTDAELEHYGRLIAARMLSKGRSMPPPEVYAAMESDYLEVLAALEAHFTHHPYLLGGLPSAGDFALIGPLFAHLGRDPKPARMMQQHAPRVFRWVEHMNTPEIQSPEFPENPMDYLPDDAVPETLLPFLRLALAKSGPGLAASAEAYREWTRQHADRAAGSLVSEEIDQPTIAVRLRGREQEAIANVHALWIFQRALDWYRGLDGAARASCDALMKECGGESLVAIELSRPLTRVHNRLALG